MRIMSHGGLKAGEKEREGAGAREGKEDSERGSVRRGKRINK